MFSSITGESNDGGSLAAQAEEFEKMRLQFQRERKGNEVQQGTHKGNIQTSIPLAHEDVHTLDAMITVQTLDEVEHKRSSSKPNNSNNNNNNFSKKDSNKSACNSVPKKIKAPNTVGIMVPTKVMMRPKAKPAIALKLTVPVAATEPVASSSGASKLKGLLGVKSTTTTIHVSEAMTAKDQAQSSKSAKVAIEKKLVVSSPSKSEKRKATNANNEKGGKGGDATVVLDKLPIDAYRDEILERVRRDRVTIIHGETGCGKSSRLPLMLYEDALATKTSCKMMVSQPRRIAATSLMRRLRSSIGDAVGMRMGHGIRDESHKTKIFFVTTGYLVRLMAYHPESFEHHTHLIIDEVYHILRITPYDVN